MDPTRAHTVPPATRKLSVLEQMNNQKLVTTTISPRHLSEKTSVDSLQIRGKPFLRGPFSYHSLMRRPAWKHMEPADISTWKSREEMTMIWISISSTTHTARITTGTRVQSLRGRIDFRS